jgi:TM2 domain-containing membrane protein YozV
MRNPIIAAVLSLIVAGLGQIYNGQITKGVLAIVAQLINGALTVILIGWILMPIVGLCTPNLPTPIPQGRTDSRTGFSHGSEV